ncbi:MAG: HAD family phosphatase [Nanoarchaeota archaeon]
MHYKLLCFDLDGVIFKDANFWMALHERFGTLEKGKELTKKYLSSDYDRLVQEVVGKLWKGKDARPYYALIDSLEYVPGVAEVFQYVRNKGMMTAIISASSIDAARRVQKEFGVDHVFANELVIREGKVSGEFSWPIGAGNEKKAEILRKLSASLNISLDECIYVGDSETDIEAFKIVGMSIAFNATSEELKRAATYKVDSKNLSDILQYIP